MSRWASVPLSLLALTAWTGCNPFSDLATTEASVPLAARCGDCHVATFAEWESSSHAQAFSSTAFLARTDHGTVESCVDCHAPGELPADPSVRPVARTSHRDEGVHCLACHRLPADEVHGGARMAGPLGSHASVQPHPISGEPERFRDAAFCGRCHEDTQAEWLAATRGEGPSCQACHMPSVRRKVTQPTGLTSRVLVALEPSAELRRHDFGVDAALDESVRVLARDFIEVRALRVAERLRVVVTHRLPHALPTGGFGRRRLRVRLLVDGTELAVAELDNHGRALAPGDELVLETRSTPARAEARVEILRRAEDGQETRIWSRGVHLLPPSTAPAPEVELVAER